MNFDYTRLRNMQMYKQR